MTPNLSPNTQAILLLTAPLITNYSTLPSEILSLSEYNRLANRLKEMQLQPSDLVSLNAADFNRVCLSVVDEGRLQRLLGRGFLLAQVVERWRTYAIWVISRADPEYPHYMKARLHMNAPALLYGCGDVSLLKSGGLAVVGSRHVDDELIDYTKSIGQLAACAKKMIISGGAKGIDQAAMQGALETGGKVCGVLTDSLAKATIRSEYRDKLLAGQLVLSSPYDPSVKFNVGNAMQRNKLVYALADVSLVVNSDLNKGGTWAGAVEQLEKYKSVPVYVRSKGKHSAGLDALHKKGALLWPDPQDLDLFNTLFNAPFQPIHNNSPVQLNSEESSARTTPASPTHYSDTQTFQTNSPLKPVQQPLPLSYGQ